MCTGQLYWTPKHNASVIPKISHNSWPPAGSYENILYKVITPSVIIMWLVLSDNQPSSHLEKYNYEISNPASP